MIKKAIISIILIALILNGSFSTLGSNVKVENDCGCSKNVASGSLIGFGYIPSDNENSNPPPLTISLNSLPTSFNWGHADIDKQTGYGIPGNNDYTTRIKNQAPNFHWWWEDLCGNCYAFAAMAALESAIEIERDSPDSNPDLSEQFLISCGLGCDGATPSEILTFLKNEDKGAIPESCFNFESEESDNIPYCSEKCSNWKDDQVVLTGGFGLSSYPDAIKGALIEYGPLYAGMEAYADFDTYTGGVYEHSSGELLGWHAVVIIGYNDDPDPGYWICKNSWGTGWGINGWFKIKYGECEIEEQIAVFKLVETDIRCTGDISISNTGPNKRVKRDIIINNNGPYNSILKWEIDSEPSWGNFKFKDKDTGEYVTSGVINRDDDSGYKYITVEFTTPGENQEVSGTIRFVNSENPDDYSDIPVSVSTLKYKELQFPMFARFLDFFNQFTAFSFFFNK